MRVRDRDIGVCSWSLQPKDTDDLISKVRSLGLEHFQLGLHEWVKREDGQLDTEIAKLKDSGLEITGTTVGFPGEDYSSIAVLARTAGFVPDEHWPGRRDLTIRASRLTARLGLDALEFHVGFIPSSSDPFYQVLVERVREVAMAMKDDDVDLLIETGQSTGSELLQFLNDTNCRNVGVNFDPANMLMYGSGDPIDAVAILNRHIGHVHVKDAIAPSQPRVQWGTEVRLGTGQVNVPELLDALDEVDYTGPMCIERETGTDRMGDIRAAIELLRASERPDEE